MPEVPPRIVEYRSNNTPLRDRALDNVVALAHVLWICFLFLLAWMIFGIGYEVLDGAICWKEDLQIERLILCAAGAVYLLYRIFVHSAIAWRCINCSPTTSRGSRQATEKVTDF